MTKLSEKMTRAAIALTMLAAGCGMPGSVDDEPVGKVQLAIEVAPSDALCLRLTASSDTSGLTVVKTVALTAGKASTAQVAGLPLGNVTFVGEVFGVACASVVATTPLTWASDKQVLTIAPDTVPVLTLSLHKAAKVNVGVDFVSDAVVEYVTLPGIPAKIAAAPDNTVYMTMTSGGYVYHGSNTFDVARFVSTSSPPKLVAVASDGVVLVTSAASATAAHTLTTYTAAGALKSTLPLGFQAGKVIVDAAKTAWIGSAAGPQVMRVATVTTAPSALLLTIGGATTAPGVALAADGTLRFTGAPGYVATYNAAGTSTGIVGLPIVPKDLAVAADGSIWAIALAGGTSGNQLVHLLTDGTTQPLFTGSTTATDVAIVTTSKGVLFTQATGGLGLLTPDNGFQNVALPDDTISTSLAVLPNGKIWAGDSRRSRAFIVTLP